MAQQYVTDSGVLYIPDAYAKYSVQTAPAGLSVSGVLLLVGEADAGPDYTLETDLDDNSFGPDQTSELIAKYKSGRIVDAFRAAVAASNDPEIPNTFTSCKIIKTNVSTKASGTLTKIGGGTYSTLYDKSYGRLGNLIYFSVAANTTETVPTTGAFTYLVNIDAFDYRIRVSGAATVGTTIAATQTPAQFQATVNALAGVTASGGANQGILAGVGPSDLTVAVVAGNAISVTRTIPWDAVLTVGSTIYIPVGSAVDGAGGINVGSYVVTGHANVNSPIYCTKLMDATGVVGTLTPPGNDGPNACGAVTDVQGYAPVIISYDAGVAVDGLGKTLQISELATNNDRLSNCCYALNTTKVTWINKASSTYVIDSAAEYSAKLTVARQYDSILEELTAGGEVGLKIAYLGTTATVTLTSTAMTSTVVGGAGAVLPTITWTEFATINDLAAFISAQTGWYAVAGTSSIGNLPPTALDRGTYNCGTTLGGYTCRIKIDAYRFFEAISSGSTLVQLGSATTPVRADAGLPATTSANTYLTGGAKGSTTNAIVLAALTACENVDGNFVVPLMSQDASTDILSALTESGSSYTIDAINGYVRAHCNSMSTLKKHHNRQGFLSHRGTFTADRLAAGNIAAWRCYMAFQDVNDVGSNGVTTFQPYISAVKAAAMQAGGFYKGILRKYISISGISHADGSFNHKSDSQVEQALQAGLLVIRKDTGGYYWACDQSTYGADSNFVYNSMQAVYDADLVAMTCRENMARLLVGKNISDVPASVAKALFESELRNLLSLKLLAPSDDAPAGFRSVVCRFLGTAYVFSAEIKLNGLVYFVPINFTITPVVQTA